MTSRFLTLSLGIGALLLATQHAFAQSARCGEREAVVAILADRYGESLQSIGLAANNGMVEVYANLESGTWTITATTPGGPTCLVASGNAFQLRGDPLPAAGDPA